MEQLTYCCVNSCIVIITKVYQLWNYFVALISFHVGIFLHSSDIVSLVKTLIHYEENEEKIGCIVIMSLGQIDATKKKENNIK